MDAKWEDQRILDLVKEKTRAKLQLAGELVERWAKYYCPVDQGYLQGSINSQVISDDTVRVSAGGTGAGTEGKKVGYAAMQEFGGVVTATNTKYLTIPLSKEAKQAKSAREMSNLVFIQTQDGRAFLAQKTARKLKYHYLLKKSVHIPASPYLRPAYLDHKDEIMKIMQL